jgi:hypothetical protein
VARSGGRRERPFGIAIAPEFSAGIGAAPALATPPQPPHRNIPAFRQVQPGPSAIRSATAAATAPVPQRRWELTTGQGIEDLRLGDFVKIDCAACNHVALLTPEALLRVGLSPAAKVLDLKGRLRYRGRLSCGGSRNGVIRDLAAVPTRNGAADRLRQRDRDQSLVMVLVGTSGASGV